MTPFAIAGVQLNLSAEHDNIGYMRSRLHLLMEIYPWVQMVVFSELAALGPSPRRAQRLPGPAENEFRDMAAQHQVWLIPGTLFEAVGDKIYNTLTVIDPAGQVAGRYRKMFPFRPYELGVDAGEDFLVFDVPDVGRFGVSICYDMWFPETSRTLAAMGAEVILHPSMTATIDRDVELAIARATAAQQQCFVFDINGAGDGGNGRSIIVGPYGDVLHTAGHSEEMIPIEIDVDRVRRSREVGLRGLGQPLKSFRDRGVHFSVYDRHSKLTHAFEQLGPLQKPHRGTRAGLRPVHNDKEAK
ncbi:MAG: carbon-nitrogen hydrolase family protein [Bryobacteraceae bacterium]